MTNETQTKPLEILVVEDTPIHQEAAKVLLAGHNVQITGTFDEAMDYICGGSNYTSPEFEGRKKHYDAVLTDMNFPQGRGDCMGDKSKAGESAPLGYALALIACKERTPYVAILSNGNHHADSIAYSMDFLNKSLQKVGESNLAISNCNGLEYAYKTTDGRIGTTETIGVEREHPFDKTKKILAVPEGAEFVKNWKAVLDLVMGHTPAK